MLRLPSAAVRGSWARWSWWFSRGRGVGLLFLAGSENLRSRLPNSTVRLLSKKPKGQPNGDEQQAIHPESRAMIEPVAQCSEQDRSENHAHIAYGAKYPHGEPSPTGKVEIGDVGRRGGATDTRAQAEQQTACYEMQIGVPQSVANDCQTAENAAGHYGGLAPVTVAEDARDADREKVDHRDGGEGVSELGGANSQAVAAQQRQYRVLRA